MDVGAGEKELICKLIFTGHLNVPERRALPEKKAKASLIYSIMEEALQTGHFFFAWWMPDDSMASCSTDYRGDGLGRIIRRYGSIDGERSTIQQFDNTRAAAEFLVQQARQFWGSNIDGVPIDWNA